MAFLGLEDPDLAVQKFLGGELDAAFKVDEFIDYALKSYAGSTARNMVFGIKKWLELGGVKVHWSRIELPAAVYVSEVDRAPTKDELKQLLHHATSARDRATILILASSGLRLGTLLSLKVGDVCFDYPDVARIKVERMKGRKFSSRGKSAQGRVYFTFITPEAKKALQYYLEERRRAGEKLTADSPLIGDADHKGKFSTVENFERVWYRLLRRAGLADKSHRWYKLHVHTLRKFFRSNCVGVDSSFREFWMGHKGGYLDESYFRPEEDKHLAEYRKAIPHLTIYGTPPEEKQLRIKAILDFARLQGYEEEKLRKMEEILARAKDLDEGIKEFRRFMEINQSNTHNTQHNGNGKYIIAKSEKELLQKLGYGWKLVQTLNNGKYLLQKTC